MKSRIGRRWGWQTMSKPKMLISNSFKTVVEWSGPAPFIVLSVEAYQTIKCLSAANHEVGWFGIVEKINNYFLIKEIIILDQKVRGDWVEISEKTLTRFYTTVAKEVGGVKKLNDLRYWGHSHYIYSIHSSIDDLEQIEKFSQCGHEWFIFSIVNRSGLIQFDLHYFELGIVIKNVPWQVDYPEDRQLREKIGQEITAKVTVMKRTKKKKTKIRRSKRK